MTTMTKEQVEKEFRAELNALLKKYNAEMEAGDHWLDYAECGSDIRIDVTIPAIYDENHNCIREWTDFDLGNYVSVKEI